MQELPLTELSICFYSCAFSSYPIPTHSKHRLIPLLKTVAASPLKIPIPSIIKEAVNNIIDTFLIVISLQQLRC